MSQEMINEIQRKAQSGIALTAPTEEKMAMYNQFQNQHTANQLSNQFANTQQNPQFQAMEGMLRQATDGMFAQQQAMLGQARDQQIAELQKAYNDAVMQGQMSVRDAERAFQENSQQINQQAYQQAQMTNLAGEERGIGNSQQLMGLMAGDNQRKNSMINQNMTERDRRVADVKDRINNIKLSKDLDIGTANANYNYGLASARGQADQFFAQNMFGVHQNDYQANRDFQMDLGKQQFQQQLNFQTMDKNQRQVLEQLATQHGFRLAEMDHGQVLELARMAVQQGYNIDMAHIQDELTRGQMKLGSELKINEMRVGHNLDMQKIGTQHANAMKQIGVQNANAIAMLDRKLQLEIDAEEKAFQKSVQREAQMLGLEPGSSSYDVYMKKKQEEQDTKYAQMFSDHVFQANLANNLGILDQGVTPAQKNIFGGTKKGEAEREKAEIEAYNRALANLQNPSGLASPGSFGQPMTPSAPQQGWLNFGSFGQSSHPYQQYR